MANLRPSYLLWVVSAIFVLSAQPARAQEAGGIISIGEQGIYRFNLTDTFDLRPRDPSVTSPAPGRPVWVLSCEEDTAAKPPPGTRFWLIRYAAWKAGDYDLRDLLAWPAGFSMDRVKPMIVSVVDPLPPNHQGNLETGHAPELQLPMPPARRWVLAAGTVWLTGFLGLLWLGWLRPDPHRFRGPGGEASLKRRHLLETLRVGETSFITPQTRATCEQELLSLLFEDYAPGKANIMERLQQLSDHPEGSRIWAEYQQWSALAAIKPTTAPEPLIHYLNPTTATQPISKP